MKRSKKYLDASSRKEKNKKYSKDEAVKLVPPIKMTLEKALEFINSDELVEVTPQNVRMRKTILDSAERRRRASRSKK